MASNESFSQISVQRSELSAVLGADEDEDFEVLGRAMAYGVGEVLVPRDWLIDRCRDLGIPERILPSQPRPHSAYKRAQARLVTSNPDEGPRTDKRTIHVEAVDVPLNVDLSLKSGDGRSNINHLRADVFYPEVACGEEGGKYVTHEMGTFDYDTDTQTTVSRKSDDCPEALGDLWDELQVRSKRLHDKMMNHHTGDDLRHMVYLNMILNSPPDWPDIIALRDAGVFYFVPEGELVHVIESLAQLFAEIDERYKKGGSRVEIRTFEIVDSEDKREWISERVEDSLEELVDDVIDEAFESFDEGDETVDEIVSTVVERLGEGGNTADQYNDLLQAKLDVEAMLASRADQVNDSEKEQLINKAMAKANL